MFGILFNIAWAMGPTPEGGQGSPGGGLTTLIPFIIIFVIFYFLLIRPQSKRQKEHRQMLENIKKGDKVITQGGIYGLVDSVEKNTVVLKVGENVKIKLGKAYIAGIRSASDED